MNKDDQAVSRASNQDTPSGQGLERSQQQASALARPIYSSVPGNRQSDVVMSTVAMTALSAIAAAP